MRQAGNCVEPEMFCEKAKFLDKLHFDSLTCTVNLGFKERLNKEQIGNSKPFLVNNLLVYLINREQISISEQFCDDQKVPYYQV